MIRSPPLWKVTKRAHRILADLSSIANIECIFNYSLIITQVIIFVSKVRRKDDGNYNNKARKKNIRR